MAGAAHLLLWATVGWALREVGSLSRFLIVAVAGFALLRDGGIVRLPYPQRHWQIPAHWVGGRGVLPAMTWATLLGIGLLTFLPYASFFIGPTVALWSGNPALGAMLGLAYGVGRALPTLTALARPLASPHQALTSLRTGRRWARLAASLAAGIALLALAPVG